MDAFTAWQKPTSLAALPPGEEMLVFIPNEVFFLEQVADSLLRDQAEDWSYLPHKNGCLEEIAWGQVMCWMQLRWSKEDICCLFQTPGKEAHSDRVFWLECGSPMNLLGYTLTSLLCSHILLCSMRGSFLNLPHLPCYNSLIYNLLSTLTLHALFIKYMLMRIKINMLFFI